MTLHGIETKMEIWYQFSWEPVYWAAHALVASTGIAWYWRNMMVIWYQFSREGIGQLRLRLWQFLLLVQWKLVTAVQESATPPLPAAITF